MTIQSKKNFLVNIAFFGVLIFIFYLLIKYGLPWLTPFIIAIIISSALQKPIKHLSSRTKLNPRICSVLIMTIVFVALGCLIFLMGYQIADDISSFFSNLVLDIDKQIESNSNLSQFEALISILPFGISDTILKISQLISTDLINIIKEFAGSISGYLTLAITRIPKLMVTFVITIVASFFFCMDYDKIKAFIKIQFPKRYQSLVSEIKDYMVTTVFKMTKSYTIIIFITFIELSIGMFIVGVKFPLVVAAIIAVIDILPVLGTGTVLIPWGIISFIMNDWITGIKLLIIYAIITIVRNIIEPKIVGNQIGLNPIITLVAMYVGLQTFGVLGVFLFPLTILVLRQLRNAGIIRLWKSPKNIES